MKEMVQRMRKHRQNEAKTVASADGPGTAGAGTISANVTGKGGKGIPARTSIQQTQGSNNLIKKETANRRSYLNK